MYDEEAIKAALNIPLFAGRSAKDISVTQLGGQTNTNFLVDVDGAKYVLRLAGVGTETIINRKSDAANSQVAFEIGVSTKVVYVDESTGTMLREYVEGSPLANEDFRNPKKIEHAARAIKAIHESNRTFDTRFDILEKLDEYEAMVRNSGGPVPIDYFELAKLTEDARKTMQDYPVDLCPCHNDLVAPNFLDVGDRFLILDWEYSGMNDPMFDLAALAAEADLTPAEEQLMFESYFASDVPPLDACRMAIYRVLWDQWVTLWSMNQIANWSVSDNFWDWGMVHMEKFKRGVLGDAFAQNVQRLSGTHL